MNNTIWLWVSLGMLLPCSALTQAQKNTPPVPDEVKKLTFGNVEVSGQKTVKFSNKQENIRLTGQNTLVTVTEKKSNSVLKIHADTIVLKFSKDEVTEIDMSGHVRYNSVQTSKAGARTLDGTAGTGLYKHKSKLITLTGGVNMTFTDEERLASPGTLKASRVTVDTTKQPYSYDIAGGNGADIRFEPKPAANAKPGTGSIRQVHVSGFSSGVFRSGEQAAFRGSDTVAEFDGSDGGKARIEGDSLEAQFGGDKSTLIRGEAKGNARYSITRKNADGKREETAKGSSNTAVYDVTDETIKLTGKVDATAIAPESLQSPARLLADQITIRMGEPYLYEIVSTPERALLKFTPLPPKKTKSPDTLDAPSSRRFVLGEVKVSNFGKGTWKPGSMAELSGGKPLFESADPESKARIRLQAGLLTANFNPADPADPDALSRTSASGGVTFDIVQPASKDKPQTAIKGKAERATYLNKTQNGRLDMTGPVTADVIDPEHLVEPGKVTGGNDTTLSVIFLPEGYDFEVDSPSETASVKFKPRDKSEEDEKKKAAPTKTVAKPTKKAGSKE